MPWGLGALASCGAHSIPPACSPVYKSFVSKQSLQLPSTCWLGDYHSYHELVSKHQI